MKWAQDFAPFDVDSYAICAFGMRFRTCACEILRNCGIEGEFCKNASFGKLKFKGRGGSTFCESQK